jgi:hypothetical protein
VRHWRARAWLLAGLFAMACGSTGRDFARPQADQLVLGRTTYADIVSRFGRPEQHRTVTNNGEQVTAISYSYTGPGAASSAEGVSAAKSMGFYFLRNTLVGYEYVSTFKADSSDFDDTRIGDIQRGATTEAQVKDLVGRPTGMYIFPLIPRQDGHALLYLHGQKKGSAPFARKQLLVTVDAAGIVRDVQFEKTGDW